MTKNHGASVKDDEAYEELRKQGYSKSKSAAIANAQANPDMHPSKKGGRSAPYEEWSKQELYERAQELDVPQRSYMSKGELIDALRS